MANYKIKIDLQKLTGATIENRNGQSVVVIPTNAEGVFQGQKGCYLDLVALQMANPRYDDTHIVKVSLSKEQRDAGKDVPILGGLREVGGQQQQPYQPQQDFISNDDLPF